MNVFEQMVRLFAPHTCLGCAVEEDTLLCDACLQQVVPVPSRCYRCKAVTENYAVCQACAGRTPLKRVIVYAQHQGYAKELIHRMKYERAQAGIGEVGVLLSERKWHVPGNAVLSHVPTATGRVRQRGYDHARLLAKTFARAVALPYRTSLVRIGQAHQVGATRAERLQQLRGAFRAVHASELRGKHVVLVDDVLTTGATLETAARELKKAGVRQVSAIVFAQA